MLFALPPYLNSQAGHTQARWGRRVACSPFVAPRLHIGSATDCPSSQGSSTWRVAHGWLLLWLQVLTRAPEAAGAAAHAPPQDRRGAVSGKRLPSSSARNLRACGPSTPLPAGTGHGPAGRGSRRARRTLPTLTWLGVGATRSCGASTRPAASMQAGRRCVMCRP